MRVRGCTFVFLDVYFPHSQSLPDTLPGSHFCDSCRPRKNNRINIGSLEILIIQEIGIYVGEVPSPNVQVFQMFSVLQALQDCFVFERNRYAWSIL